MARLREFLVHYGVYQAPKNLAERHARVWLPAAYHVQYLASETLLSCDLSDGGVVEHVQSAYGLLQGPHVWGWDTVASKVIHFLNPSLFMMWDVPIQSRFKLSGPKGYVEFLRLMRAEAREAVRDFEQLSLPQAPKEFLSEQLGYSEVRPLTKLIDDFNWVTITKGWPTSPPEWFLGLFEGGLQ